MISLGDIEIRRVEQMLGPSFEPSFLFPDWRPELLERHRHWMVPNFFDSETAKFISSIHSWVLRTKHHVILVDTCAGDQKRRPSFPRFDMLDTPYVQRLFEAGIAPQDVDYVFCTHLHVDHVGWNTRLVDGSWVPTFPNAKYVFSKAERDYWDAATGAGGKLSLNENVFEDSVRPILEAGLAEVIEGTHQLGDNLLIEPAAGHSPGHCIMKLASGDAQGLFSGDVMHQPVQIYEPALNTRFCSDPETARASRRAVLEHCACTGALLLPAHFGFPHVGRVHEEAGQFRFVCEGSE